MPEAAEVVAERITEALAPTFRVHANDVAMRASIGIALGQRPQETPDDLLRDADLAMYLAKRNGKGRFEMYRPEHARRRRPSTRDRRRDAGGPRGGSVRGLLSADRRRAHRPARSAPKHSSVGTTRAGASSPRSSSSRSPKLPV